MNKQTMKMGGDLPKYGAQGNRDMGTIWAILVPETTAACLVEFVESNATSDSQKFIEVI